MFLGSLSINNDFWTYSTEYIDTLTFSGHNYDSEINDLQICCKEGTSQIYYLQDCCKKGMSNIEYLTKFCKKVQATIKHLEGMKSCCTTDVVFPPVIIIKPEPIKEEKPRDKPKPRTEPKPLPIPILINSCDNEPMLFNNVNAYMEWFHKGHTNCGCNNNLSQKVVTLPGHNNTDKVYLIEHIFNIETDGYYSEVYKLKWNTEIIYIGSISHQQLADRHIFNYTVFDTYMIQWKPVCKDMFFEYKKQYEKYIKYGKKPIEYPKVIPTPVELPRIEPVAVATFNFIGASRQGIKKRFTVYEDSNLYYTKRQEERWFYLVDDDPFDNKRTYINIFYWLNLPSLCSIKTIELYPGYTPEK